GTTGGLHSVRATAGDREAIAEVRVSTEGQRPDDEGGKQDDTKPGKRLIRWRGTIPYQKWSNFYMKVLRGFASSPDLKIEVSFEVPIDSDQAQSKMEETRSGLKELGLDDTISLS